MKRLLSAVGPALTFAALSSACVHASMTTGKAPSAVGATAWEALKRDLPGTWEMKGKKEPFVVTYKLVSAGSALVETWGAGGAHETLTVLHPDHTELLLVHYCAQGNQPRLRAVESGPDGVSFRYVDATNIMPGQGVLTERRLRISAGGDELEHTEVYRQPQGGDETTVYRLRRVPSPQASKVTAF
jgi:hypothetical protein